MIMIALSLYFYTKYDTTLSFCEWKILYITTNRKSQIKIVKLLNGLISIFQIRVLWTFA